MPSKRERSPLPREGLSRGRGVRSSLTAARGGPSKAAEGEEEALSTAANFRTVVFIEDGLPRDLLGDPIRPGAGRKGRPCHLPTPETREQVAAMHRDGEAQPSIARAIGITIPTLTRHYWYELRSEAQNWRKMKAMSGGASNE